MRFDIITIFPKIFDSYLSESILRRAQEKKLITIKTHNLRQFTTDKHRTVDDTPYGGGAGMVLKAEPIMKAVDKLLGRAKSKNPPSLKLRRVRTKIIILSAKGKQFNQKYARELAKKYKQIILVSGRYEGIDERVRTILKAEEVSIGHYVLSDGDVAAMAVISAVSRLIPGVIKPKSLKEESHFNFLKSKEAGGTKKGFEYPHYTKPEVLIWKGRKYRVPKVLLSGDHKKIKEWRERHNK